MTKPCGAVLLAVLTAACHSARTGKSVIVLGVDGMDPNFVAAHWSDLPNLRRLRNQGGLTKLATTTPPQSPVAWSTFITGTDPAQHGLFDFIHRDPVTLAPISSMAEVIAPTHTLNIGPWQLPLSSAGVRSFRHGRAFWQIIFDADIPVTVVRMPTNYPPVEKAGFAIAGMGTPDLEGTFGTFTFYTDDPAAAQVTDVSGGRIVAITVTNNRVTLPIEGPPNTLRHDRAQTELSLAANIDVQAEAAIFDIAGQRFILKQGEWSPWIHVQFPLIPHLASASGMFRLYIQQLTPAIHIYRSPLNIDPADPALPIATPRGYGKELAFYTQGIEEDTAALRQGVFDLTEYLRQSQIVSDEHTVLLRDTLDHFHGGFLFFYFSEIDQNSHVLWGHHDAELLKTYQLIDKNIGTVLDREPNATVIVMSDHGFAAFDYAVNLNTWLEQEGFLTLNQKSNPTFADIDWKKTKAYAMGLNALYINHKNPDANLSDLTDRLKHFRPAIASVTPMKSTSPYAPDLIVGYAPGYRASWETALGAIPPDIIHANNDAWIADHCMDAAAVPGVLIGTRTPHVPNPQIKDVTVTILKEFNLQPDPAMTGRPLY
jgi:predicted AlkP superfamily phosphohydrolase/phosphomutase